MEQKPWVRKYVHALKKKDRLEILEEAIASEGMSPDNELRKKLMEARYQKREGQDIDLFIRGWMSFYYLQNTLHSFFGKRRVKKELDAIRSDWQLELCREYGEAGAQVLYEEFCNMSLVYFDLCQRDKSYSSIILGIGRMKDSSLIAKIAKDVYTLAYVLPQETGTTEDFALFAKAATDMFCEQYEEQKEYLLNKIRA